MSDENAHNINEEIWKGYLWNIYNNTCLLNNITRWYDLWYEIDEWK